MARRKLTPRSIEPDWFLAEWLASKRMSQAELCRRTDWSTSFASDLMRGISSYSRRHVNEAAAALHIHPFELLMHPREANELRTLRETAVRIAAEAREAYVPPEQAVAPPAEDRPSRKPARRAA